MKWTEWMRLKSSVSLNAILYIICLLSLEKEYFLQGSEQSIFVFDFHLVKVSLLTLSPTSSTWQAPSKLTVVCLRPLKGLSGSNRSLFHHWLRFNGPLSDLTGDRSVTTWPPFTHHPSGIIWRRNPWSDSTPPPSQLLSVFTLNP